MLELTLELPKRVLDCELTQAQTNGPKTSDRLGGKKLTNRLKLDEALNILRKQVD